MEKENYFETIKWRFIKSVMRTNDYGEDNDVNRNHTNYGSCTCWAQVLRDMGHDIEMPVYEDNGVLKIPFISIDNEKILEFEK